MIQELLAEQTDLAYLAMRELRVSVGSEAEFVDRVNRLQRPEGYRLVGSFVDGEEQAAAVAGFRTGHFLAWGYALYCDELSTRQVFRRQGQSRSRATSTGGLRRHRQGHCGHNAARILLCQL